MLRHLLEYLLFQCILAEGYMYHVAILSETSWFFFWGGRSWSSMRMNGYPSSGGGPKTSRPRAIFTTIVQLDKPIATKVLLPDPGCLYPVCARVGYELL